MSPYFCQVSLTRASFVGNNVSVVEDDFSSASKYFKYALSIPFRDLQNFSGIIEPNLYVNNDPSHFLVLEHYGYLGMGTKGGRKGWKMIKKI